MSVFSAPPKTTQYTFRRGDQGQGVGALQLALGIVADGDFGPHTEQAVIDYQKQHGLAPDGVAGHATQTEIADDFGRQSRLRYVLPSGLVYGLLDSESGFYIAAVNWSVSGGVDCGYTQRRVYGPPWDAVKVRAAFDSKRQIDLFSKSTRDRYDSYRAYSAVRAKPDPDEYAWRLAALHHNWPYAAGRLANGNPLSTAKAPWAGAARFHDGVPVVTYRDWAAYYAMGSHKHDHRGQVCRYAFGVPPWDYS